MRTSAVDADASWRTAGTDGRDLARFAHSPSSKGIIRTGFERNDLILRGSVSCPMLETSTHVCPSATNSSTFAVTPTVEKSGAPLSSDGIETTKGKAEESERRGKAGERKRREMRETIRILGDKKNHRSKRQENEMEGKIRRSSQLNNEKSTK